MNKEDGGMKSQRDIFQGLPSLSLSAVEEAVCHAWLAVSERIKSPSVGINLRRAAEILFESLQLHWQLSGDAHTHLHTHMGAHTQYTSEQI